MCSHHRFDLAFPQTLPGNSLGAGTLQGRLLTSCAGKHSLVWEDGIASSHAAMSWVILPPTGLKCKPCHRHYRHYLCLPTLLFCDHLMSCCNEASWELSCDPSLQNYTHHYLCPMVLAISAYTKFRCLTGLCRIISMFSHKKAAADPGTESSP